MHLAFRSDGSVSYTGFHLEYKGKCEHLISASWFHLYFLQEDNSAVAIVSGYLCISQRRLLTVHLMKQLCIFLSVRRKLVFP